MTKDVRTLTPDDVDFAKRVAGMLACRFPSIEADEFEGIALLALVEAARRFEPGRGTLHGLAFACIRAAIYDYGRRRYGRRFRRSEVELAERNQWVEPIAEAAVAFGEALDVAADLSERHVGVLVRHRLAGKDMETVGREMGISKAAVFRLNARLTEELEKRLGEPEAA